MRFKREGNAGRSWSVARDTSDITNENPKFGLFLYSYRPIG